MYGLYEGAIITWKPADPADPNPELAVVAIIEPFDEVWGLPIVLTNGERYWITDPGGIYVPGPGWYMAESDHWGRHGELDGGQIAFKLMS
jgi:hypothetical protein